MQQFIFTKISIDIVTHEIIERNGFWYDGNIELACGASGTEKQVGQEQNTLFNNLTSQAQSIFGSSSTAFSDLMGAFAPIVAAGPNQEGWTPAMMSLENSGVINNTAAQARNASTAVKEDIAAQGGGNVALPSGAAIGEDLSVANAAAANEANELQQNKITSAELGRQNFFSAAGGLAGAPSVFNSATSAGSTAVSGGTAASKTQNQISQNDNAWISSVTGALGGIAGDVATGGMENLGAGVGFFGGNSPAPS